MVVDVENADDAGDGGGGLHVGVLQAHLHGGKKLFKNLKAMARKLSKLLFVNANIF